MSRRRPPDDSPTPLNPGAFCPSCERFIGPVGACPYCDADSARSPLLLRLRVLALLLGTGGLVFLYLMAIRRDLPEVRIGEISPTMTYAAVRVAGRVERDAYVGARDGKTDYVSFPVSDGSGTLRVAAYDEVAQDLAGQGRLPRRGQNIRASGNLRIGSDGKLRLHLLKADRLETE